MGTRVYQLAKELEMPSKDLVQFIQEHGFTVKNHMSMLDEETAVLVRQEIVLTAGAATDSSQAPEQAQVPVEQDTPAQRSLPEQDRLSEDEPEKADAEQPSDEDEQEEEAPAEGAEGEIHLTGAVTVKELAEKVDMKPNALIQKLMGIGVFASINQILEVQAIKDVCGAIGCPVVFESGRREVKKTKTAPAKDESDIELAIIDSTPDSHEELVPRAPVVTIMGHVDHGKTSILDYIRKTKVAKGESGGITQHIGASKIESKSGPIIFLDTPGHKAFTSMRARGAQVTDIVVLVVAADDGVMPQTIEAMDHAQAAGVPIVVAVNKIDLPGAEPDRVRRELAERELTPEDWGGETIFVNVSAITGEGIDALLEMILLQAEILELKSNPNRKASAVVVESCLEKGKGATATVLVKNGTLKVGDTLICGPHVGRVRALIDDCNKRIPSAGPSDPVEILGLSGVPEPGTECHVVSDEKNAKILTQLRSHREREDVLSSFQRVTLEDLYLSQVQEFSLIVKGDTHGSVEALAKSLEEIKSDKINLKIIHKAVGDLNESDVLLASASGAVVIAFHVRVDPKIQEVARREEVQVRTYSVIYQAIDDVRAAMEGMLAPIYEEVSLGEAEVKQIFKISKLGNIAGCIVMKGSIPRNAQVKVKRGEEVLFSGKIDILKRFKDEVKEVKQGQDCGIRVDGFVAFEEGDIIEAFRVEEKKNSL